MIINYSLKLKYHKKLVLILFLAATIEEKVTIFFSNNKKKFDLIFIDGLHEYQQVRKDILNSIKCLKEGGFILVHDCLPRSISAQAVPRFRNIWNGDVWKAIVEFRTNSNLEIYTCSG